MTRVRVGVIYGGRSSEHEVSIASASAVMANLDRNRYEPVPLYIARDGRWHVPSQPPSTTVAADVIRHARTEPERASAAGRDVYFVAHPSEAPILTVRPNHEPADRVAEGVSAVVGSLGVDVMFPMVHGPFGEDGTLQGLLELANLPYVGAGVLASAVAMDKAVAKTLFASAGLATPAHLVVYADEWAHDREAVRDRISAALPSPWFVKPANLGSSIGISKAGNVIELAAALDAARQFDPKMVIETAVPNARELECAVVGNDAPDASVVGEILPAGDFYDYESKYVDDRSRLIIPAQLAPEQTREIQGMAVRAFKALEGSGMARVDFLMNQSSSEIYINEVNTIPGFTTISMYAKLWEATGIPYAELLDRLITLAIERHHARQQLRTSLT